MGDRNEKTIAGAYRQKNVTVGTTPTTIYDLLQAASFVWGDQDVAYVNQVDLLSDGSGDVLYETVLDGDAVAHSAGSEKSFPMEDASRQLKLSVASGTETITIGLWL